ncbi:MAG TPA: hypothetical protein VFU73_01085 [Actinocrinis sp.]|nr:hypothetical protein [Actinocrinis sp.]
MRKLSRLATWTGLGLFLLVAGPAAANAATVHANGNCPADMLWDVATQSCVLAG